MLEFPCKWDELSNTIGEASTKESEAPHEASVPSDAVGEVSTNRGEAIPYSGCKAAGDGKGSWKMQWFTKPTKDP